MSGPIKLLTRLFSRNPTNALLAEVYSKAINQPLFVHPAIGETIVHGYLHSQPAQLHNDAGRRGENQSEAAVGVLDISGALVSRYTPGPSGTGPLSYEEIREDFDTLMADRDINTIIGRFDSPGGMAAQNMDLADHIYASRGQGKKLIAMVDDMAYSAAFALASSFDEVWITRTGGVGSVGVVSYHADQSEFNQKLGVKIEYLYAGAQKIDGNPHEPLSDSARDRFNGEIMRLYNLFTATVARNMGMSVETVKATEAGTFHGEKAVEAGFAHKVGTFYELMQSLIPEGESSVTAITMEEQALEQEIEGGPEINQAGADPSEQEDTEIPDGDDAAGADDSDSPEEQQAADQATKNAAKIRAMCTAAGVPDAAQHYIESGETVENVRAELFDMITAGETEIINASPAGLVKDQKAENDNGWKSAFAKVRR